MEKVTLTPNEILVVKCENCISRERLKALRNDLANEMKDGIVIIPPGFSYSILKNNITTIENGE